MIESLKTYFDKKTLKDYSCILLNKYEPWLSEEKIRNLFSTIFNEDPSLFDIVGNERKVIEDLMINYCHNEAFIKAAFARELKKHKAVSLFELPIGDSRADLCSINGSSVAYEIKTIFDTTKRLFKQVNDYLLAFEYVYVICPMEKTNDILSIIPDEVGIYEYNNAKRKPSFKMIKEAKISNCINRNVQLSILRKSEKPSNIDQMSDFDVNSLFKKALKERYRSKWKSLCENMNSIYQMDYQYSFNNF